MDELICQPYYICSLTLKKCQSKSYRNDIKYHTTLNIIFSVANFWDLAFVKTYELVYTHNANFYK